MTDKKSVLLVGTSFRGLYKDIIEELEKQGYVVEWVEEPTYRNKLLTGLLRLNLKWCNDLYLYRKNCYCEKFWKEKLASFDNDKHYDYLLTIDGDSTCDYFFDRIDCLYPNIKKVLYLFDSICSFRRFDLYFKYYHKVYSFDIDDCEKYNINLLPIWWKPLDVKDSNNYDIFGFASFDKSFVRYNVFHSVLQQAKAKGLRPYIKLLEPVKHYSWFEKKIRILFKMTPSLFADPEIITNEPLPPLTYRGLINSSRIILDALGHTQSGMTTRFSWAIGAKKKIITDNKAVIRYPFYDPNLICVVSKEKDYQVPESFWVEDVSLSINLLNEIDKFRIDNFVNELFM